MCSVMVQYHGLGLLYQIRRSDRLGVTKLVAKLTKTPLKSPYAACHLVRLNVFRLVKSSFYIFTLLDSDCLQTD